MSVSSKPDQDQEIRIEIETKGKDERSDYYWLKKRQAVRLIKQLQESFDLRP